MEKQTLSIFKKRTSAQRDNSLNRKNNPPERKKKTLQTKNQMRKKKTFKNAKKIKSLTRKSSTLSTAINSFFR